MKEQPISPDIACSRTDHEDGYIELSLLNSSKQAVDELLAHFLDLNQHPPANPLVRILVSNSSANKEPQPIAYLMSKLRKDRESLIPTKPTRIAVQFNLMLLIPLVDRFIRALKTPNVQFKGFRIQDRDATLEWLFDD